MSPVSIQGTSAARQGDWEDGGPRAAPRNGIGGLKSGKLFTVPLAWREI